MGLNVFALYSVYRHLCWWLGLFWYRLMIDFDIGFIDHLGRNTFLWSVHVPVHFCLTEEVSVNAWKKNSFVENIDNEKFFCIIMSNRDVNAFQFNRFTIRLNVLMYIHVLRDLMFVPIQLAFRMQMIKKLYVLSMLKNLKSEDCKMYARCVVTGSTYITLIK